MSEGGVASDALSVSATLLQARTAAGLSQTEVADALFLTVDMITFLDAGEYDRMPNQAFVRGYLRSYARMVDLDPNQLIRQFDEESRQAEPDNIEPPAPKSVLEPRFSGVVQAGLISLGLIAVLVFAVLMFSSEDELLRSPSAEISATPSMPSNPTSQVRLEVGPSETEATPVTMPAAEDSEGASELTTTAPLGVTVIEEGATLDELSPVLPELDVSVDINDGLTPEAEAKTETETETETEAPIRLEESSERGSESTMVIKSANLIAATTGETDALIDEPAASDLEAVTSRFGLDSRPRALDAISISRENFDGGRRIWVDAGGSDELTAELSDACWIEVADGQGERIYGDLNKAGDALVISGLAPFEVLLGNAPVVSLAFNGEPVDLARKTTRELTARVTLGN